VLNAYFLQERARTRRHRASEKDRNQEERARIDADASKEGTDYLMELLQK